MKFKIVCLFLATVMLLTPSVGAHDLHDDAFETPSIEEYAIEGDDSVSPLALLCTLFGHADPVERNDGTYTQTMCINVGDSQCRAVCYRYQYCSRESCGENLGYALTGHHVRDGYCIRRMWDQYEASWIYDCITCG